MDVEEEKDLTKSEDELVLTANLDDAFDEHESDPEVFAAEDLYDEEEESPLESDTRDLDY